MTEPEEEVALRLVALLVIVSLASVLTLWTLDTTSTSAQSDYALFLAVDLVSFAMISYIYRESKGGEAMRRVPLLAGAALLVVLIAGGLWALGG
jgi:uncharacterized membrane protein